MKGQVPNPLISIIVPVYNADLYLERCVGSILKQTYENLELICVDDGSTDRSGLLLDKIAEQDVRLKVIHTENKGAAAARNTALTVAMGVYIGFVDADDYIHENMYEHLVNLIIKNDVDFVTCGYCFDDGESIKKAFNREKVPLEPMNRMETLYYIYKRDEYKGVAGYLWNRLFKKELIKGEGENLIVQFDESLDIGEDIVFLAEVCRKVKKTLYTDQTLYYYYQRQNSAVHDDIKQLKQMSWIHAYERIISIYENMGMPADLLDIIRRMYVYRCGKLLEIAIKYKDEDKADILENNIKKYLFQYIETNLEHPDRIQWIQDLIYKTK